MNKKQSNSHEIWVFCETEDGDVLESCLSLLGEATGLAATLDGIACAVLIHHSGCHNLPMLTAAGAVKIYTIDHPSLSHIEDGLYSELITSLAKQYHPEILLMTATIHGRSIAPQVAAKLRTGLTADCTELSIDERGLLVQTRPAFGGSLMANIICPTARPQMASVRAGCFGPPQWDFDRSGQVVDIPFDGGLQPMVHLLESVAEKEKHTLSGAQIVIAGGMGMAAKHDFEKLEKLAKACGGVVGASRAAVHAGFAPYRCQIGQTGIIVQPELYIAFGISGAVQHLTGMSSSKYVIAVNVDPKAAIFDYCDYGIVADASITAGLLTDALSGPHPQTLD